MFDMNTTENTVPFTLRDRLSYQDNGRAATLLFFIPLGAWMALYLLIHRTEFGNIGNDHWLQFLVTGLCVVALVVREFLYGRWNKRALLGAVITVVCCVLLATSSWNYLATAPLFIFAGRNIPFRKIVKFTLPLMIALWLFVIFCALVGIIPNETSNWGDRYRFFLGFLHPNVMAGMYFFILCQIVFLRRKDLGLFEAIVLAAVALLVYKFTLSRTAVAVSLMLLVFAYFIKFMPSGFFNSRGVGIAAAVFCACIAVLCILVTVIFDPNIVWIYKLNSVLSGRLVLGQYALNTYGISWLGSHIDFPDVYVDLATGGLGSVPTPSTVDDLFVRMLLLCGIPFTVIALALAAISCYVAWRRGHHYAALAIAFIFVYSITEIYGAFLYFNPFLFLIGSIFGIDYRKGDTSTMPNIKIAVAAHKDYWMPSDEMYLPIQVNAANAGKLLRGFQPDNTGDNISADNPHYCELTALYWAWKNLDADYIGLAHYRRHFAGAGERDTLTKGEAAALVKWFPVVLPHKRHYYIETIESHYSNTMGEGQIDYLRDAIKELCPHYLETFNEHMQMRSGHMFNMMIMRKDLLDAYCAWMFPILRHVEARIDFTRLSDFDARMMGRLSERLLDTWIDYNKVRYIENPVVGMEKTNWLKKGGSFLRAKFGGKRYEASF